MHTAGSPTRVIPVLSSGDRGQENPAVARRELLRQAYTPQPDFNRVGSEQAQRPCPKMTNEGSALWPLAPGPQGRPCVGASGGSHVPGDMLGGTTCNTENVPRK